MGQGAVRLGHPVSRARASRKMQSLPCASMCGASASPEILEPRRRQFGVAHRVLDIAVPEVGLQRARVVPLVGQGVAAGVPEHVRVRLEAELGLDPRSLDHAGEASGA